MLKRIGDGIRELILAGFVDLIDGRQIHFIQGRIGGALNGAEHATLAGSDKQNGFAGAPSTTGAADAVDVAFGVIRNVVVQHVADPLNVKTTGSNICCDQNVETAVFKLINRTLTLCLRDVSVDGCGGESASTELFSKFFRFVLGAHEYDHGLKLGDLKNAGQGIELVAVRDRQVTLGDVGVGTGLGLDRDFLRFTKVLAGDLADTVGHGGGKQCNLLVFRSVGKNTLDVFLEAHVEHLVCLVQHEETQIRDVQGPLFEVVDNTTRGTDDDLCTAAKAGQLNAIGLATIDRQHMDATKAGGEGLEAVCNLQRKLTGGGQDQSLGFTHVQVNPGKDWQCECSGLTSTGLCEAHDVVAFHQHRDGLRLNGGRGLEAHLFDCCEHIRRESKAFKTIFRAGSLRFFRFPDVFLDVLRMIFHFRQVHVFQLFNAAGDVIGIAHCFSHCTRSAPV